MRVTSILVSILMILLSACGGEPRSKEQQQALITALASIKAGSVLVCEEKASGQLTALQIKHIEPTLPYVRARECTKNSCGLTAIRDLPKILESCSPRSVTIYPERSDEAAVIVGKLVLGLPTDLKKSDILISKAGGIAKVQRFAGSIASFYGPGLTALGPDDPRYQCANNLAIAGKPYDAGLCEGEPY